MSFVPKWISHLHAISSAWLLRQSNMYAALASEYMICDLKSVTEFVFSLHYTRICTEMIPKWTSVTTLNLICNTSLSALQGFYSLPSLVFKHSKPGRSARPPFMNTVYGVKCRFTDEYTPGYTPISYLLRLSQSRIYATSFPGPLSYPSLSLAL